MSGGFRAGPSCHLSSRKQNKSHLVFSRSGVWSLVGWLVSVMWQMLHCTFPPRNDQLETFLARKGGLCPPFFWTDKITVSTAKYNKVLRGRNRRAKLYCVFSFPQQLNRWPCHSLTDSLTHSLTNFYFWHYRVTLETCDLWDIWSEWWGNMTWPTFWQFFLTILTIFDIYWHFLIFFWQFWQF